MIAARKAVALVALVVLAWTAWTTSARGDVDYEGPASDGSIREGARVVSPRDAPAASAVDPGSASEAEVVSPSETQDARVVSPRGQEDARSAVEPGSTELEPISPRDHEALPSLSPGESRRREIYNPRDLSAPPPRAEEPVRDGVASHGSVRQPAPEIAIPTEDYSLEPAEPAEPGEQGGTLGRAEPSGRHATSGSPVDLSSFGRSAAAGETGAAAVWRGKRVMPASIYQGWLCKSREFVKHGEETLQVCDGIWVRRLLWAGQAGYVPIYPPEGAELEQLPAKQVTVTAGGRTYVVASATFYERVEAGGSARFRVQRAPIGAVVPSLPRVALDLGSGVFQLDSVFFRESGGQYTVIAEPR